MRPKLKKNSMILIFFICIITLVVSPCILQADAQTLPEAQFNILVNGNILPPSYYKITAGQEFTVDASDSYHPDPNRTIVKYEWDWDFTLNEFTADADGLTKDHSYNYIGSFYIGLRITDDLGQQSITYKRVDIECRTAPTADPGGPYEIMWGENLVLDGSRSTDPDIVYGDSIVSYQWDINGDNYFEVNACNPTISFSQLQTLINQTGQILTPTNPLTGYPVYPIQLKVKDTTNREHTAYTRLSVWSNDAVVNISSPYGSSAVMAPGQCLELPIAISVTGNLSSTATFKVYQDWLLTNSGFIGSNPVTFTVEPRTSQEPAAFFTTSGTIRVDVDKTAGDALLAFSAFDISPAGAMTLGESAWHLVTVVYDNIQPNTEASLSGTIGENGWYVSDVQITFTASDNQGGAGIKLTEYSFDGVSWNAYTNPFLVDSEGSNTIYYRSIDNAGNTELTKTLMFNIDKTDPVLQMPDDLTAEATGLTTYVNIGQATANDNYLVSVYSDAPEYFLLGVTNVTWTAVDVSGNIATGTQKVSIVDSTKPVLSMPADVSTNAAGERTLVDIGQATAFDIFPVTITNDAPNDFPVGETTVTWTAIDSNGNISIGTQKVNVIDDTSDTTPPGIVIDTPQPYDVIPYGTTLVFSASDEQSDLVSGEPIGHLSDGTSLIDISSGYTPGAGVYTLQVEATDLAGNTSTESRFFTVYDPDGGFVTGGGWINSPPGAYTLNPSLSDKATFGFVSKYQKGTTIPTGRTEFQLHIANLNFQSENYEWLVVAGARGQFKGTGTINKTGNYGFMLTAIDGQVKGGGGVDKFRIKIWDKDNDDAIVYDNLIGASDTAEPTTALGGGSIVIHK